MNRNYFNSSAFDEELDKIIAKATTVEELRVLSKHVIDKAIKQIELLNLNK